MNRLRCFVMAAVLVMSSVACGGDRVPGSGSEAPSAEASQVGAAVFGRVCAECHAGSGEARAPGVMALSGMSPRAIVAALETGTMRVYGEGLTREERVGVAEFLTQASFMETPLPPSVYCESGAGSEPGPGPVLWTGWGGDLEGTGFQPSDRAGLTAADVPKLRLKWAFAFPEAAEVRTKPSVVGDRVIVSGGFGEVLSLDAASGCVQWRYAAEAAVRGGVVVGEGASGRLTAYFVDFRTNAYAVDVADGRLIWKTRVGRHHDASNTGTPALYGGRLYIPLSSMEVVTATNPEYECCTSSGAVVALDAATGEEAWYHRVIRESPVAVGENAVGTVLRAPSGAPVWSSPTIDAARGVLYVGTGENYTRPTTTSSDAILALDLATGARRWSFQATAEDAYNLACVAAQDTENCPTPVGPDLDFGMAPILVRAIGGRDILVVGQKSGVVWALDPDREGAVIWSTRVGKGSALGGVHWGMATEGDKVYAANADRADAVVVDVNPERDPSPGLYALDLGTGDRVWAAPAPRETCEGRTGCFVANSAAPSAIPGVVFAGGLDGHIRAHSSADGSVLWDFDTATEFQAVGGLKGVGGAIDGPGPVIAGGMLFVNSGYGRFGQMPGNVLLAFAPDPG